MKQYHGYGIEEQESMIVFEHQFYINQTSEHLKELERKQKQ